MSASSRRRRWSAILVAAASVLASAWPGVANPSPPAGPHGPPPGPSVLYAPPARSPLLENVRGWRAPPILVSGAFAYRDGEYVYQDYLFDDRGADTTIFPLPPQPRPGPFASGFAGGTGDVVYPRAPRRCGYNCADLLELRIRPVPTAWHSGSP